MSFDIKLMRPGTSGDSLVYTLTPDGNANQSKEVMGDNKITFTIDSSYMIYFRMGDYADVYNERYYIYNIPVAEKGSSREYAYTVVMYADYKQLENAQYLFLNVDNDLKEGSFTLMGNPDEFIDKVIENINRISSGWTKGEVVPGIYKNLTFNGESCLQVLSRLAEAYDTEYKVEGRKIHLAKRAKNTGITLRNGFDKGLYQIRREIADSTSVITRLYAYGSDKNLPSDYRGYSLRLKMTGGIDYVEKNTDVYGIIEQVKIFEDIYPHRTGVVTAVNNLNFYSFTDTSLDFDINDYKLPGVNIKVTFNTGQLAGYTFDVNNYNPTTKTFIVNKNKNEKTIDVPSSDFRISIGDKYVLVDIRMPDSYITAAEAELKTQAELYLTNLSKPVLKYTVTTDPAFMRKNSIVLDVGDKIWIIDTELEISRMIRINQVTRGFEDEYDFQVVLSDDSITGFVDSINNGISGNSRGISDINNQIDNRQAENNFVGDVTVDQGTLILSDIQPLPVGMTGVQVVIGTDGRLYKA